MEVTMFYKIINVKYQFLFITFLIFLFCEITTAQDEGEIIETLVGEEDSTSERGFTGRDFHFLYLLSQRYVTFKSNHRWMVFY